MERSLSTQRMLSFIGGLGLGLGVMYVLDPDQGGRRRARLRQRAIRGSSRLRTTLGRRGREMGRRMKDRARGLLSATRSRFQSTPDVDLTIGKRVRSCLDRFVSHPQAIDVAVDEGRVTLRGPILTSEMEPLIAAIEAMPGVQKVEDRLDPRPDRERIPSLQGFRYGSRRTRLAADPVMRIALGLAGLTAVLVAARVIQQRRGSEPQTGHSGTPDYVHSPLQEAHVY